MSYALLALLVIALFLVLVFLRKKYDKKEKEVKELRRDIKRLMEDFEEEVTYQNVEKLKNQRK